MISPTRCAREISTISTVFVSKYGLDSLDLCELASKEVSLVFSERALGATV